jgi:hypothetical protein
MGDAYGHPNLTCTVTTIVWGQIKSPCGVRNPAIMVRTDCTHHGFEPEGTFLHAFKIIQF